MSSYDREIARLDRALDAIGENELVGDDRDSINSARTLIRSVRDRLVGADHDEDRRRRLRLDPEASTSESNGHGDKPARRTRKEVTA